MPNRLENSKLGIRKTTFAVYHIATTYICIYAYTELDWTELVTRNLGVFVGTLFLLLCTRHTYVA